VAARSEAALRQELVVLGVALPLAFIVATGAWKRLALVGVILLLIAVELINTAIEKLSDQVTAERHPQIGAIKDMSSAAVGLTIVIAGITWLVALGERVGFW
jgi:diacylglycerol kinase (ATP)